MAFKMKGSSFYGKGNQSKSPAKKELIGGQENLPSELKAKIEAAPGKMYDSPAKHSTNREGHNYSYDTYDEEGENVTKKHTNADHPKYWKVQERTKTTSDKNPDYSEKKTYKYLTSDGEPFPTNELEQFGPYTDNPDYDASATTDRRTNRKKTKYYASDKDREIQDTKYYKKGGDYMGDNVYNENAGDEGYTGTNTADRVGKTDGNTYRTGSKSKSKSSSSSKSNKSSKKKVSYEASYTSAVADKWKDKGGKDAYIKAAKAYNAKKRK